MGDGRVLLDLFSHHSLWFYKRKKDMKKIDGFENYSVTRDGRVWSWKSKIFLSSGLAGRGYPNVVLYKDGKGHPKLVHRLVAQAYIPNPDNKPEVNHKDGNKENNYLNNLEWATSSENRYHGYKIGLHGSGEDHHMAKLTQMQVDYIRDQYSTGKYNYQRLANAFKVSYSNIAHIITNRKWKK